MTNILDRVEFNENFPQNFLSNNKMKAKRFKTRKINKEIIERNIKRYSMWEREHNCILAVWLDIEAHIDYLTWTLEEFVEKYQDKALKFIWKKNL